jgi:muramoyltetrapeptide carboxypeptidase
MLTQLLHAGVLNKQKAIVLGQFTEFKLTPHDRGFNMTSVIAWLRSKVKVPVLTNLPYGHVQTKVLLPFGANCDMISEGRDALLAWGHVA